MPTSSSFLLRNAIVVPMEGRKEVFDPGSVLVLDGRIAAVGNVDEIDHHPAVGAVPTGSARWISPSRCPAGPASRCSGWAGTSNGPRPSCD